MNTVAIVLYPDFLLLDMAGPVEVFSIANRYLPAEQHYQLTTLSSEQLTLISSNGVKVQADRLLAQAAEHYDLLLVPGGPGAYNDPHPMLVDWLRSAPTRATRYGSICTGAFILGKAGLLDEQRVTTHWHYTERLMRHFPKARVETDHIYLQDGAMITSGGVTAGIDLALSVVAQDHGKKVALDVAKVLLVVTRRQGSQAQFSPLITPQAGLPVTQETAISRVQNYLHAHLEEPFSVERMAELAAMSPRHFARTFAREVQMTPMEFLQRVRIDRARSLLESTDLPLKTIAFRSGFGSARHMRTLFADKLGLTPVQYRLQFS